MTAPEEVLSTMRSARGLLEKRIKDARGGRWFPDETDNDEDAGTYSVRAEWSYGAHTVAVLKGGLPEGNFANAHYVVAAQPYVLEAFLPLLKQAEVDLWAHGAPDGCLTCGGCDECDDLPHAPYVRAALKAAIEVLTQAG